MESEPRTPTLYTFGYASLAGADDLRELLGDRVRAVIDVRLRTYSGKRAFSTTTRLTVESAGYGYLWADGLGNALYREGGMALKRPGDIGLVVSALDAGDVALMCACLHADACHRSMVADLAQRWLPELRVVHLEPLGALPFPPTRT